MLLGNPQHRSLTVYLAAAASSSDSLGNTWAYDETNYVYGTLGLMVCDLTARSNFPQLQDGVPGVQEFHGRLLHFAQLICQVAHVPIGLRHSHSIHRDLSGLPASHGGS